MFHFLQSGKVYGMESNSTEKANKGRNKTWNSHLQVTSHGETYHFKGKESTSKKESEKDCYHKATDFLVKKYDMKIPDKLASKA